MSIKSFIISNLAARMTSLEREQARRTAAEKARRAAGAPHLVEYFHQADDPYAHLVVQALAAFRDRYDVKLEHHLVSPPTDAAAPERAMLVAYSRRDAAMLAAKAGLTFVDPGVQPDPARTAEAERLLAATPGDAFPERAAAIGAALWSGAPLPDGPQADAEPMKARGDARREELGHYLGGVIHYGGEWYWGVDRLHFLEARLAALGARKASAPPEPIYTQPPSPRGGGDVRGAPLDFFLSFRSPYTYIATERVKALADAWGAELRLRFVLPMVMRGLPIPDAKRRYIPLDTAREARRLGVPFGKICDPVGKPVERGYAILAWAMTQGRGYEFVLQFMCAVWSEGVDAGEDKGLALITERAGLDWAAAKAHLGDEGWRAIAAGNREEMFALGLWGVPSFQFGAVSVWGQDRLWAIEDAMAAHAAQVRS